MPLKLMYITNKKEIAQIAETAGVDRIFVDMEYIGKSDRQGGMDTVQSHHTVEDVKRIKGAIEKAELLVRINPIHVSTEEYYSTEEEVEEVIAAGADIIMLPFFKTAYEVEKLVDIVAKRAKIMPLVETPEAVSSIDEIVNIKGVDEFFVGLNDLSLGLKKKFMFELLADGTVEELSRKFKQKEVPFGFGGIAALGYGMLPAEMIIKEHYRLGSTSAILSRSFCNTEKLQHMGEISSLFISGVSAIRQFEKEVKKYNDYFEENRKDIRKIVKEIETSS